MADVVFLDDAGSRDVLAGSSCAFGVFDGVHKGHRFLIDQARLSAEAKGGACVALTFDIDPDELFHPERLRKLLSNDERLEMLARTGVDAVAVLRFNREFAALAPDAFLRKTFADNLPTCIHVGWDFRFGSKASGDLTTLASWGRAHGVEVTGHELLEQDGAPITATRIRQLIEVGEAAAARDLLGR